MSDRSDRRARFGRCPGVRGDLALRDAFRPLKPGARHQHGPGKDANCQRRGKREERGPTARGRRRLRRRIGDDAWPEDGRRERDGRLVSARVDGAAAVVPKAVRVVRREAAPALDQAAFQGMAADPAVAACRVQAEGGARGPQPVHRGGSRSNAHKILGMAESTAASSATLRALSRVQDLPDCLETSTRASTRPCVVE